MHQALEQLPRQIREKLHQCPFPDWIEPMLATLTHDYFSDSHWLYERKLDGQRCLLFKKGKQIRLLSRNQQSQNAVYPEIERALKSLTGEFVLDSEFITFKGRLSSFSRLQKRMHVNKPDPDLIKTVPVYAYLFDLLYYQGYDLTQLPLRERKKLLKKVLTFKDPLRFVPHRNTEGETYLQQACHKGWEGLIAKQASSAYQAGRSKKWLKFKCGHGQEFVIGGYTRPQGERMGFGALLLGYHDNAGKLHYAGRVGTGFDHAFLNTFSQRLKKLKRKDCPFDAFEDSKEAITWVKPQLVCEVAFTEWTDAAKLRHPRFLGLRNDKSAHEVIREDTQAG